MPEGSYRSSRRRGLALGCWLALGAGLAGPSPATAAGPPSMEDLKGMDLDQLLGVQITSVSRRPESLARTAAAVDVITGEQLRRSGASTLPEALRHVTGLQVSRVGAREWAISARGFTNTTANKLLVMIDGRSVYTPLYSGVFWDVQDVLLADVERIEVIRGPGATTWGANAVNGVINVITRSAADTHGWHVEAGAGDEVRVDAAVRHGARLGDAAHGRVYAKLVQEDDMALAGGAGADDERRHAQAGFRLDGERDGEAWRLQGDAYGSRFGGAGAADIDARGANLLGQAHRGSRLGDARLQAWLDYTGRDMPEAFTEDRLTWDTDVQVHRRRGRHEWVWGLGYRGTWDDVGDGATIFWEPSSRTSHLFSGFAQDEISLRDDRLRLMAGLKVEHNSFSGLEWQPSVRAAWQLRPQQTVWAAVSRAVRSPTRIDRAIRVTDGEGNVRFRGDSDFDSEDLLAWELGWRARPNERIALGVAAFYHDYTDLRSQEPSGPAVLPLVLSNGLQGTAVGLEIDADWHPVPWWRWSAAWAWLDKELKLAPGSADPLGGTGEGNDAPHRLWLQSAVDLPGGVQADLFVRFVDELPQPRVPAYAEADVRLAWQARPGLTLEVLGGDLLDDRHAEYGAAGSRRLVERSIQGRVTWHR